MSLLDPNGIVIKSKADNSEGIDPKGKISDDTFRVPTDAILGRWTAKGIERGEKRGYYRIPSYRIDGLKWQESS